MCHKENEESYNAMFPTVEQYFKYSTEENKKALKKQKNYCNRLYKRERKNYYSQLNMKNVIDNKKSSDEVGIKESIVLVDMDKILS